MSVPSWSTVRMAAAICAGTAVLCAAAEQRLLAQASRPTATPAPAAAPAPGVRVWTSDVVSDERAASAAGTLHPMLIVGARNGTFSGKVVVDSSGPVKGLRAAVTGGDETALLAECDRAEQAALENYEDALHEALPDYLKEMIRQQHGEIQESLQHIRALKQSYRKS